MKFETFNSGSWQQQYQYKSFAPVKVNHLWLWEDPRINNLLESANRALGELNAFSLIVPDIDLFIEMHVIKEAQASSKIEGTQTGIDEALMSEEQISPEKRDDWREVQNYIKATNMAVNALKNLPLSIRLIKQAHQQIMHGARGEHKQPGEFRTSQNWIGGSNLSDATFIPPHQDKVIELMSDLEQFWHNQEVTVPHLIRIAISHYQFETIHPFLDGNGRVGRLLIPLYLISHGLLAKPSLYMSSFFERNRSSYYDALTRVRESNDLIHWVRFFLSGLEQTAIQGRDVFNSIRTLQAQVDQKIATLGKRTGLGQKVMQLLYKQPIITAAQLEQELDITPPTANSIIKALVAKQVLVELTGKQRKRQYIFDDYINLFVA